MPRPACVAHVDDLPWQKRPRFTHGPNVRAQVRGLGDATGLSHMGVWLRSIPPGHAGTNRHYHEVEEEWAYVLSGTGAVRIGPLRIDVRPGHFVGFPPGPRPHCFVAGDREPLVLLEGGERRPEEDAGFYVDAGRGWRGGRSFETQGPLPPEEGDPAQCLHVQDLDARDFQHPVDGGARRVYRTLSRPAGLERQVVRWARVAAGDRSTAYHTHTRTDEWLYILQGRARARVGDERFDVAAGDFLGHPAGGAPHVMEPLTDLVYLMGGESDPDDVVLYPDAGVQKRSGKIEPMTEEGSG